jgi:Ca-activated chloride channel family protein
MIVLKADESMEKSDLAPSRLEHARLKIADLSEVRKGQPLGLIAYAGSAHLVLPPTRDTTVVKNMAREVSPAVMPKLGDRLDLAIREAGRILREGGQGGSIVVLADGVNVEPQLLQAIPNEVSFPIQFLATNTSRSPEDSSLASAAKMLKAKVEPLRVDGRDISAIVRRAAGSAATVRDSSFEQWQDEGYWLVPLIALLLLNGFRRKRIGEYT